MDEEDFAKSWADFRERLDRGDPKLLAIREHVRRLMAPPPRDVVPPTDAEIANEMDGLVAEQNRGERFREWLFAPQPERAAGLEELPEGFDMEMPLDDEPFPEW